MKKAFKFLFGWLGNRYVLSVLGLVCLCLIIWFIGPLIAVAGWAPLGPETTRWIVMIAVAFVWGLVSVGSALRQRRANAAAVADLMHSGKPEAADPGAEEKQELQARFHEALGLLKRARLGQRGRRRYLYQLPWYVIIGPPGAGKTTALRNSGLEFPLSEHFGDHKVRGVGGTRNCDWWFTDEAVILDTAGRYTTQDSDQAADAAAWQGFLDLLRKHRRRRPLDGVIVAVGADILARARPEEIEEHAQRVRQRLQEITGRLGLQLPVYFMLTKCDLVSGFVEFFDDLGREGRNQVFGFTFEATDAGQQPLREIDTRFDELFASLDGRRLDRLGHEGSAARRGQIYNFPQQLASLRPAIKTFTERAFGATRYEAPVLLRGVYFTSGTQEGTPIDRLMANMAGRFGFDRASMSAFSGKGRSYFLTRLLRELVFQEASLVGARGFLARYRGTADRLAYGGTAAVALLLGLALLTSFWRNEALIGEVEAELDAAPEAPTAQSASVGATVRYLNWLRDLPGGYAEDTGAIPVLMGLGLYQGNKLGAAAERAYARGLEQVLLPRLLSRLEQQMSQARERTDFLYEALKVYLMLGHPQRLDRELVETWVKLDWRQVLGGEADTGLNADFAGHLEALLDDGYEAPRLNGALVAEVRQALSRMTLAQRVYAQIKSGPRAAEMPDWRLPEVVGTGAADYFRVNGGPAGARSIPGLMTRAGYRKVFLAEGPQVLNQALEETWVLGEDYAQRQERREASSLLSRVTEIYFDDYIRAWESYLQEVSVRRFRGLRDGSEMLNELGSLNSPIKQFLRAVTQETSLSAKSLAGGQEQAESGALAKVQKRVQQLLDVVEEQRPGADPAAAVERRFQPIHDLVRTSESGAAEIDRVLEMLRELSTHLGEIDLAAGRGDAAIAAASDQATGRSLIGRVRLQARRQPDPLGRWLAALAEQAAAVTLRDAGQRSSSVWESKLYPFCRDALSNRYPFAPESPQEVNLADFTKFFGPEGMVDGFFGQYLKPFVDTSVSPWRKLASAGGALQVDQSALNNLERARAIKRAFFQSGSATPKVEFQLRPLTLDSAASQVVLEIGEQRIAYRHGPSRFRAMQWPPPGGAQRARVQFTPLQGGPASGYSANGPWAWFRLLDRAQIGSAGSQDRLNVTFESKGMTAVFELQASSLVNPFTMNALESFRCMNGL